MYYMGFHTNVKMKKEKKCLRVILFFATDYWKTYLLQKKERKPFVDGQKRRERRENDKFSQKNFLICWQKKCWKSAQCCWGRGGILQQSILFWLEKWWYLSKKSRSNTTLNKKLMHIHSVEIEGFFLSFRFYVKPILENLEFLQVPVLPFLWLWKFGEFQSSKSAKIHQNENSEPLNVLTWQILPFLDSPKLILRKNLSDRKIMKFSHCDILMTS